MIYFVQQAFFVFRFRYFMRMITWVRKTLLYAAGMRIGKGTMMPKIYVNWPNQVVIGNSCILEQNIYFKFSDIWQRGPAIRIGDNVFIGAGCEFNIVSGIDVGNNSLIASGCKFIDHDHGMNTIQLMRDQPGPAKAIKIGSNVWLGFNVIVLKGVEIGDGAVVGAGAVVTKPILPGEIWTGVPAKKIGIRL